MNLHISGDEKFIDFFIGDVRRLGLSAQNDFLVYTTSQAPLKFVRSDGIIRLQVGTDEWKRFVGSDLTRYERVFVHYYDGLLFDTIQQLPPGIKVIWCFYGNDGFMYFPAARFLQPLTRRLFREFESRNRRFSGKLFKPLHRINDFRQLLKRRRIMKAAFLRVNYFANFMQSDFHFIRKEIGLPMISHIELTFVSLEGILLRSCDDYTDLPAELGNNILVGNSATYTNNHLEVFEKLRHLDLDGRKIYCPLSYGQTDYADEVAARGKALFGEKFVPLRDFMPLVEYNELIATCGIMIMNHERTQAAGNVIMSIFNGACVLLNRHSGLYEFLSGLGVYVYPMEENEPLPASAIQSLTREQVLTNRRAMYEYFGSKKHDQRMLSALNC